MKLVIMIYLYTKAPPVGVEPTFIQLCTYRLEGVANMGALFFMQAPGIEPGLRRKGF